MTLSTPSDHAVAVPSGVARRVRAPLLTAAGAALFGAALVVRDPHRSGSWGHCPFLLLTGHPCPGCGGLRAVNDLLHGDVGAALGSNAYAVATLALGLTLWVLWLVRRVRGGTYDWTPLQGRLASAWLAGLVLFGALRLFVPALHGLQP